MATFNARMSGRPDLSRARGGLTLKPPTELLPFLQAVMIVVAAAVIFWPALHGGWLWDDNIDITENPVTKSANGLWSIWFEPGSQRDYYPVKASVQWAQWHLWGNATLGYHVTNLALHIVSALLVWRLFHKLGLKLAWLGGLIFAVHPVQVESVAWITELKNTLSMPFFLLAAIFYLDYDEHARSRDYRFALGLFLVAMLTKPTMVMFPVVILLHAWWKRRQIERDDLEASVPFFAVSLFLGAVTLTMASWYRHLHLEGLGSIPHVGFFSRLALVGLSTAFYLGQTVWPAGLLPIYPLWRVNPPSLAQFLPWPVLGGLLFWFWTKRQTWGRDVLFGVGFFLVMLLPFSGAVPASFMNNTWVMDHFLYIPILGLIGLAIAGLELGARLSPPPVRYAGIGLLAVMFTAMIAQSRAYAKKFVDQEALWTYTLTRNPTSCLVYNDLGGAFALKGRLDEAIVQFQKCLEINPNYAAAHYNLGMAFAQKGQPGEAIVQFRRALEINPNYLAACNNLGNVFFQEGRLDEAIGQYRRTLEINPNYVTAYNNLGMAFAQKGQVDEATAQFQAALRLNPNDTYARTGLAKVQAMARQAPGSK
ncbi:MAG: tetratricopeptide repeat protein [Methylacidiphilales bacterium]|nr:tetratricopeptide repeat protein [Candidatus Methylacidiphilales bacterium]